MTNETKQQDAATPKLETHLEQATAAARAMGFGWGANAAAYEFNKAIKSLTDPDGTIQLTGHALEQAKLTIGKTIANNLAESTKLHNSAVAKLGLSVTQSLQDEVAKVCMAKNNLPYVPLNVLDEANEHIQNIDKTYGKLSALTDNDLHITETGGQTYNITNDCAP